MTKAEAAVIANAMERARKAIIGAHDSKHGTSERRRLLGEAHDEVERILLMAAAELYPPIRSERGDEFPRTNCT